MSVFTVKNAYPSLRHFNENRIVPIADVKRAHKTAARLVAKHGEQYLALFIRLENEIQDRQTNKDMLQRALDMAK